MALERRHKHQSMACWENSVEREMGSCPSQSGQAQEYPGAPTPSSPPLPSPKGREFAKEDRREWKDKIKGQGCGDSV